VVKLTDLFSASEYSHCPRTICFKISLPWEPYCAERDVDGSADVDKCEDEAMGRSEGSFLGFFAVGALLSLRFLFFEANCCVVLST
jgi:hypothetical protein